MSGPRGVENSWDDNEDSYESTEKSAADTFISEHLSNQPDVELLAHCFINRGGQIEGDVDEQAAYFNGAMRDSLIDFKYIPMSTNKVILIEVESGKITQISYNQGDENDEDWVAIKSVNPLVADDFKKKYEEKLNDNIITTPLIFKPLWKDGKHIVKLSAIDIVSLMQICFVDSTPGFGTRTLLKFLANKLGENGDNGKESNDELKYLNEELKYLREEKYSPLLLREDDNDSKDILEWFDGGNAVRDKNILVLVDGSGEPDVSDDQFLRLVREIILRAPQNNAKTKIIKSGRFIGNNAQKTAKSFKLLLMDEEMQVRCLSSICERGADTLLDLRNMGFDNEFTGNPLLLTFIACMKGAYSNNERCSYVFPQTKSALLEHLIDTLILLRWDAMVGAECGFSIEDYRNILTRIAYRNLFEGTTITSLSVQTVVGEVQKTIKQKTIASCDDKVVKELLYRSGLVKRLDSNKYQFIHQDFLNYLGARELFGKSDLDIKKILSDIIYKDDMTQKNTEKIDRMSEVILMLVGIWNDRGDDSDIWEILGFLVASARSTMSDGKNTIKSAWLCWICGKILSLHNFRLIKELDELCTIEGMGVILKKYLDILFSCNEIMVKVIADENLELKKRVETARTLWMLNMSFKNEKLRISDFEDKIGDVREGIGVKKLDNDKIIPDIKWCKIDGGEMILGRKCGQGKDEVKERYSGMLFTREEPCTDKIAVKDFKISKYPITIDQYMLFVQDGAYTDESHWHWSAAGLTWFRENAGNRKDVNWYNINTGNAPIVDISWIEAQCFCRWLSKKLDKYIRLPYEVEWEYVAESKSGSELFAFGDKFEDIKTKCISDALALDRAAPVGLIDLDENFPADLNGNVWEWTQTIMPQEESLKNYKRNNVDWWLKDGEQDTWLSSETEMVVRGGSFLNAPFQLRNTFRGRDTIGATIPARQGFRVVWQDCPPDTVSAVTKVRKKTKVHNKQKDIKSSEPKEPFYSVKKTGTGATYNSLKEITFIYKVKKASDGCSKEKCKVCHMNDANWTGNAILEEGNIKVRLDDACPLHSEIHRILMNEQPQMRVGSAITVYLPTGNAFGEKGIKKGALEIDKGQSICCYLESRLTEGER